MKSDQKIFWTNEGEKETKLSGEAVTDDLRYNVNLSRRQKNADEKEE